MGSNGQQMTANPVQPASHHADPGGGDRTRAVRATISGVRALISELEHVEHELEDVRRAFSKTRRPRGAVSVLLVWRTPKRLTNGAGPAELVPYRYTRGVDRPLQRLKEFSPSFIRRCYHEDDAKELVEHQKSYRQLQRFHRKLRGHWLKILAIHDATDGDAASAAATLDRARTNAMTAQRQRRERAEAIVSHLEKLHGWLVDLEHQADEAMRRIAGIRRGKFPRMYATYMGKPSRTSQLVGRPGPRLVYQPIPSVQAWFKGYDTTRGVHLAEIVRSGLGSARYGYKQQGDLIVKIADEREAHREALKKYIHTLAKYERSKHGTF